MDHNLTAPPGLTASMATAMNHYLVALWLQGLHVKATRCPHCLFIPAHYYKTIQVYVFGYTLAIPKKAFVTYSKECVCE